MSKDIEGLGECSSCIVYSKQIDKASKIIEEKDREIEELKKETTMTNVYIGKRQLSIKQHEANLLETKIAELKQKNAIIKALAQD